MQTEDVQRRPNDLSTNHHILYQLLSHYEYKVSKELLFPIEEVVYEYEGEQMCSEELALAQLLVDDVLLPFEATDKLGNKTTALFVNTSDDFAWGCADCEPLTNDEIPNLYRMHIADCKCGALRWACLRRNMQPQAPRKKLMIEAGSWDEVLEALPENSYDGARRAGSLEG